MKKTGITGVLLGLLGCAAPEETIDRLAPPDANRFVQEVMVTNLYEPTELVVLPNGDVLFTQRRGSIQRWDAEAGTLSQYDSLEVYHRQEDGLMGIALDPDFEYNQWVYLYYSPPGDVPVQYLSRFSYTPSGLTNEIVVLKVDTQRDECCHTGGSIEFGPDGLLYLSTGDDTNPFASRGFGPFDETPGRSAWDAQRSSANTNDLRGKILRIKPNPDGTYSIPKGNLFEDDDPRTRPEIYVMGCRNPYRIAVDSRRGWLFWGDVGPDAFADDSLRGPKGHDEFNIATSPGFYGWPYFVGDSKPYIDYDFATGKSGAPFNAAQPLNLSPNNTGLDTLPPARPAKIYYPYARTETFPQLLTGARNAMAGPVYYADDYKGSGQFPEFFDGRVFYYDWMRGLVFSLGLDEEGNITDWYRFMPQLELNNLIDMTFGPNGELYLLEYGTGWFTRNKNAKLSKVSYTGGNRKPVVKARIYPESGATPLEVKLEASESMDYDGDSLRFVWQIEDEKVTTADATFTFTEPGVYYPRLTVSDGKGNKVSQQFVVSVGNESPVVKVTIGGNQSFYWPGRLVHYETSVTDLEDGKLGQGIDPAAVTFSIHHLESTDRAQVLGHQVPVSNGQTLIESLDCKGCHKVDEPSIGPSYLAVAQRYAGQPNAVAYLSGKIITGGGGVWGEQAMSAHPDLPLADAESIVKYILNLGKTTTYPLQGTYTTTEASGSYLLQATYTDRGKAPLAPSTVSSEVLLRSTKFPAAMSEELNEIEVFERSGQVSRLSNIGEGSWFVFRKLDLTGVQAIAIHPRMVREPGVVSIRTGAPDGQEIGSIAFAADAKNLTTTVDVQGVHDVYFVFRGSERATSRLLDMEYVEFSPKTSEK